MTRILVLLILLSALTIAPISYSPAFAKTKALACDVVFVEDSSHGVQKRMRIFAWSKAKTPNDRLATAKHIAIDSIKRTGYDFVDVILMDSDWPKNRDSFSENTWLKYAPDPSVIPFMSTRWTGKTAKDNIKRDDKFGYWSMTTIDGMVEGFEYTANNNCGGKVILKKLKASR